MNSELLNQILELALKALIPVLVFGLTGVAKAYFDRLKAEVGNERWEFAANAARVAVSYAEQIGLAGAVKKIGSEKKALALAMLQAALDSQGIKLDVKAVEALIESEVWESLNKYKDKVGVPPAALKMASARPA